MSFASNKPRTVNDMTTRITTQDMEHLRAFPAEKKAQIMQHVSHESVTQAITYTGSNYYDKAILKLRQEGYGLIDMQPMETACTMLWYRKISPLFSLKRSEYAVMVMLEYEMEDGTDVTTLRTWKV